MISCAMRGVSCYNRGRFVGLVEMSPCLRNLISGGERRGERSWTGSTTRTRAVGVTGRGRWYATQQINQAYVMLLASHFQGFCRDLHSESIEFLVGLAQPLFLQPIVRTSLVDGRKLSRGNANFDNIREDFERLDIDLSVELDSFDPPPRPLRRKLQDLNNWRNALAHQDFSRLGGSERLRLVQVRQWRKACDQLARVFEKVIHRYLQSLSGVSPW